MVRRGKDIEQVLLQPDQVPTKEAHNAPLSHPDGSKATTPEEICEEIPAYYTDILANDRSEEQALEELLQDRIRPTTQIPRERIREVCETLTQEDVLKIIRNSPRDKSPGPDGLTAEFYKAFVGQICPILTRVLKYSLENRVLTQDFTSGDCKLLFKGKGSPSDLAKWRPITLLNTDCKMMTSWPASKLQLLIPYIINQAQTGFIKGRSIKTLQRIFKCCPVPLLLRRLSLSYLASYSRNQPLVPTLGTDLYSIPSNGPSSYAYDLFNDPGTIRRGSAPRQLGCPGQDGLAALDWCAYRYH